MVYVIDGVEKIDCGILSSIERYDVTSGHWSTMAAMDSARYYFGVCVVAGEIYVTGGW
jgi:hypothetical protein